MKTFKILLLIILTGFFLNSCELEPDHSIRVKNDFSETINNVKIGSVEYGSVSYGSMTGYMPVEEGSHTLSGNSESGGTLSGSVSVEGNGEHNWTLTITSDGKVEIEEDE